MGYLAHTDEVVAVLHIFHDFCMINYCMLLTSHTTPHATSLLLGRRLLLLLLGRRLLLLQSESSETRTRWLPLTAVLDNTAAKSTSRDMGLREENAFRRGHRRLSSRGFCSSLRQRKRSRDRERRYRAEFVSYIFKGPD